MKKFLIICLFLISCGNASQKTPSVKKTPETSITNPKPEPESSQGSSSQSSSSNSGNTVQTKPVESEEKPKYYSQWNLLITPEFELDIMETGFTNEEKLNHQEKEALLTKWYQYFKKNVFFGNEVYTLKKITFKRNKKMTSYTPTGNYSSLTGRINIMFTPSMLDRNVGYALSHEYYHHLSMSYMPIIFRYSFEENLYEDAQKTKRKNLILPEYLKNEDYMFAEYKKMLNNTHSNLSDIWKKLEDPKVISTFNLFNKYANYHKLRSKYDAKYKFMTYRNGYYPRGDYPLVNNWVNEMRYLADPSEFLSRSITIYTSGLPDSLKTANNSIKINGLRLWDYLLNLFLKSNMYYKYQNLKINYNIEQNPIEKTNVELEQQYQIWKDYFSNTLYNHDQVLSSAFSEFKRILSPPLYIVLNNKKAKLSFERKDGKSLPEKLKITKLLSKGNFMYYKKPFDNSERKSFTIESQPFKIENLSPGTYYVKVNGNYLTEGLDLEKMTNKTKKIYTLITKGVVVREPGKAYTSWESKYTFIKKDNKIILEVI